MSESAVLIAALGVVSACVGGLIWIIKFLFEKLLPRIDEGNVALSHLAKATDQNTRATKAADAYLRDRNGRDAEHAKVSLENTNRTHKELIAAIAEIPAQIIATADVTAKALHNLPAQQVKKQEVQTQIVVEKKAE